MKVFIACTDILRVVSVTASSTEICTMPISMLSKFAAAGEFCRLSQINRTHQGDKVKDKIHANRPKGCRNETKLHATVEIAFRLLDLNSLY